MTPGSGLIGRLGARRTLGFIAAGWIAFSFQLPASSFQPHVRETGGRKLETGARKLETGGRKLEAGRWELEAGGRKLETGGRELEAGGWELEAGGWELEAGGWELGTGGWELEAGDWELGTGSWRLATDTQQLAPTAHPALPRNLEDYWFVPGPRDRAAGRAYGSLTSAAAAYAAGNFGAALTDASAAARVAGPLAQYALYYQGLAELRLSRTADAQRTFDAILEDKPEGHLSTAVLLAKAETADAGGNHATALGMYEKLAAQKTVAPDDVLLRLGRAALSAGDRPKAAEALLRVYYEFPLSDSATTAATLLTDLQGVIRRNGYDLDLGRAKILFGAKRYAEARSAFQDLQRQTGGDDRELTDLRIAECDFFLKRYEAARDALQPYLEKASRRGEARFFYLSALRELGDQNQYLSLAQDLVRGFPTDSWAEETLNNLGSHYILTDQDELAARTFKQLYESFPTGTRAERAAWKYGWWCYRTGNWAETIRVFEGAAAAFPRSDYRPSFLYWSARAHGQLGERTVADARLRLVYTDYMNSYYGRLAARQLAERHAADAQMSSPEQVRPVSAVARAVTPADPPPTAPLITRLLAAGLLDDAANEVRYAQRVWGDSPQLQATAAWIAREKGDRIRGTILMRRAYPQHLAAGGEDLPAEVLQVIYPLTYWDSIRRYATPRGLDPYLMAALINQESKFNPDARSPANAWGLMQIEPSTGRKLARALGIRRFRTSMLTDATTNIRMGMLYFSDLVGQFGGTYYALASYNAGETRVVRWRAERPNLDEDEFIDDIPFPETQNYVKRILGTAEDYRRLYGSGEGRAQTTPAVNRTAAQSTVSHASSKPSSSSKSHTTAKKKKKAPPKKAPSKKKSAPR